jgi:prolyl oligopeptidase PreP (S9A serine peptidase family)
MFTKIITLISVSVYLLISTTSLSQDPNTIAYSQISELENGHLLVQFFSRDKTKEIILSEAGQEAFDNYEKQQLLNNKKLMSAFDNNYNFSEVLFFYSRDLEHVKLKNFNQVTFYNSKHEPIKNDSITIQLFYIGVLDRVEGDSTVYLTNKDEEVKRPNYRFSAFVIRDSQYIQLSKPFPFYTRTLKGLPLIQRKENATVRSLQYRLTKFRLKAKKKGF